MAEGKDDAALDQIVEIDRIDNRADFGRDIDLIDPDPGVGRGDFDDLGAMHAKGLGQRHATTAAIAEDVVPSRHFANRLKHLAGFIIVAKPDALGERIGACGMDQLVETRVVEKTVRRGADRTPGTDRRQFRRAVPSDALVGDGERLIPGAGDDLAVGTGHREALTTHLRDHDRGHGDAEIIGLDMTVAHRAAHPRHGNLAGEVVGHVLFT